MKASVIICTYNRDALLRDSILSVTAQEFPADEFEIIVVDNNSTDNTKNVVAELSTSSPVLLRYVFEKNQGLSHARNAGIKAAEGEIIVFTDDDIEAEKTWLNHLTSAFKSPEVGCAGGRVRPLWPSAKPSWLTQDLEWPLGILDYGEAEITVQYPKLLNGVNISFRKSAFDTVGYFNISLGRISGCLLSNEDSDMYYRISNAGYTIHYVPGAVLYHKIHPERLTKRWFQHRYYWQGRSDAAMECSHDANVHAKLQSLASAKIMRQVNGETAADFNFKLYSRYISGYLHQIVLSEKRGSFTRIRSLHTFLDQGIGVLLQRLQTSENDRAARLDVIHKLDAKLNEAEEDRAARLEVIHKLDAKLKEAEADRASCLEELERLRAISKSANVCRKNNEL